MQPLGADMENQNVRTGGHQLARSAGLHWWRRNKQEQRVLVDSATMLARRSLPRGERSGSTGWQHRPPVGLIPDRRWSSPWVPWSLQDRL